jgi:hypothetical protein
MKYTPGLLAGELSGAAGNTVAGHNRYGAYLRTRTIPVNPNTLIQRNARNNLAAASAKWRTLTDAQRGGWKTAASLIPRYDSLGRLYYQSGLQLYTGCSRNIFTYDPAAALPTDAPVGAAPASILTATITATSV